MTGARDIWAVVPFKGFANAKQRLSPVYSPVIRRELARAMLEDVLDTLMRVDSLTGILLVTQDCQARELALGRGLSVLREDAARGHSLAVTAAARELSERGSSGILTVPADIPTATAEEISSLLRAHRHGRAFTIVPSRDGRGSNAIVVSPPDGISFSFGDDSFPAHLQTARNSGLASTVKVVPGIGLDIDTPDDCRMLLQGTSPSRARDCLNRHAEAITTRGADHVD